MMCCDRGVFFFFKQKTAYEMRISDWSSDVCSSDLDKLEHRYRELAFLNSGVRIVLADERSEERKEVELHYEGGIAAFVKWLDRTKAPLFPDPIAITGQRDDIGIEVALEWNDSYYENVLAFTNNRSEEHTSELQSLMRISYAVF